MFACELCISQQFHNIQRWYIPKFGNPSSHISKRLGCGRNFRVVEVILVGRGIETDVVVLSRVVSFGWTAKAVSLYHQVQEIQISKKHVELQEIYRVMATVQFASRCLGTAR